MRSGQFNQRRELPGFTNRQGPFGDFRPHEQMAATSRP